MPKMEDVVMVKVTRETSHRLGVLSALDRCRKGDVVAALIDARVAADPNLAAVIEGGESDD